MIAAAWTLAWTVAPFIAFPVGAVIFARWVQRRTDGEGFAEDFVSFNADVAAIEASLPRMVPR